MQLIVDLLPGGNGQGVLIHIGCVSLMKYCQFQPEASAWCLPEFGQTRQDWRSAAGIFAEDLDLIEQDFGKFAAKLPGCS